MVKRTAFLMIILIFTVSSVFTPVSAEENGACRVFVPKGIDISFYKNGSVVSTYHETSDGYDIYSLSCGVYSYTSSAYGGMDLSIAGGDYYLRRIDIYTTAKYNGQYLSSQQYSVTVLDGRGNIVSGGAAYKDGNYAKYPYLLFAGDNTEVYTYIITPVNGIGLAQSVLRNKTVSPGSSVLSISSALSSLMEAQITAPEGSEVKVFNQILNYYNIEEQPSMTETSGGKTKYIFMLPFKGAGYIYRVSMPKRITKAGYFDLSSEESASFEVSFSPDEDPKVRPDYLLGEMPIKEYIDDSIYLNIGNENALDLSVGDTFSVRAFRTWEIINSITANLIIEPDFHFQVISGNCISISQNASVANIKALRKGAAVVEVTYDAIEIGGNTLFGGIYGASEPSRSGMFVVNVGDAADVDLNLNSFDSDFDTVYYTGECGSFLFTPTSRYGITVTANDVTLSPVNGTYNVPVYDGNNIVKVSAGGKDKYFVIKGKKVRAVTENLTNPGAPFTQGDRVRLSFEGLISPVRKMSGIYNPMAGTEIVYTLSDGSRISGKSSEQYAFSSGHAIEFSVFDSGDITLSGGRINMSYMGLPLGAHRKISDKGASANFNAALYSGTFCYMPVVTIHVAPAESLDYLNKIEDYAALKSINILCGENTFFNSFNFSEVSKNNITEYKSDPLPQDHCTTIVATPENTGVKTEFRYWFEGDEAKTVIPFDGTLILPAGTITDKKTVFMEIVSTPVNPVLGSSDVYSFAVYKTAVPTVLKDIKTGFPEPYDIILSDYGEGLFLTQNEYFCFAPENSVSAALSLTLQKGTGYATVKGETKMVSSADMTEFSPIPLSSGVTDIIISVGDIKYTLRIIKDSFYVLDSAENGGIACIKAFSEDSAAKFINASYSDKSLKSIRILPLQTGIKTYYFNYEAGSKIFAWNKSISPLCEVFGK